MTSTPTPPLKPCAGPCGRTLRPSRTRLDQYPDTVREESHGRCQRCKAAKFPPMGRRSKERTGYCSGCRRPTRRRDVAEELAPGTVVEYAVDQCRTCARHEREGRPIREVNDPAEWDDCGSCHRPMRPRRVRAADAEGTVRHERDGKCVTCVRREENPHRPAGPLIVGRPSRPIIRHERTAPKELRLDPVAAREVDPNLGAYYAQRRARKAAEEARKARLARTRPITRRTLVRH